MHTALPEVLGVLLSCIIVGSVAYHFKVLDIWGSALAFVMGLVIGLFGHPIWLVLLLIFLVSSFAATRYEYDFKARRRVAQGKGGKRGFENVLANGYLPMVIAFLSEPLPFGIPTIDKTVATIMFLTAISVAASDTLASELGVLSRKVVMINDPKNLVRPGINGGISAFGTAAALFAAAYASLIGWLLIATFASNLPTSHWYVVIPLVLGFLGCHVDSTLGLIENKGHINGSTVNLISIFVSSILAYMIMYILPAVGFVW